MRYDEPVIEFLPRHPTVRRGAKFFGIRSHASGPRHVVRNGVGHAGEFGIEQEVREGRIDRPCHAVFGDAEAGLRPGLVIAVAGRRSTA